MHTHKALKERKKKKRREKSTGWIAVAPAPALPDLVKCLPLLTWSGAWPTMEVDFFFSERRKNYGGHCFQVGRAMRHEIGGRAHRVSVTQINPSG